MPLFLFNYTKRLLYGIFEAASDGGFNIDPYAWENTEIQRGRYYKGPVSRYPAQVRVRICEQRPPLDEITFSPFLDYVNRSKFRLDLTALQVNYLLHLFATAQLPEHEHSAGDSECSFHIRTMHSPDPESPRSAPKSDIDYYSDCSSRGINSVEDDWSDETLVSKGHYHEDDEEAVIREGLNRVDLNEPATYDNGNFNSPAALEDQLSGCWYSAEDVAWKESFQVGPDCVSSDYDNPVMSRFLENDPIHNSNSVVCMQNDVNSQIQVDGQENGVMRPVRPHQLQFTLSGSENRVLMSLQTVHCQQAEGAPYVRYTQTGKRSSGANPCKQGFSQQSSNSVEQTSDNQNAHMQQQKMKVLAPLCAQVPGQMGDQAQLATLFSPMLVTTDGPLTFAELQTGANVDESSQSLKLPNDIRILPERLEQFLQSGQRQIILMPSIIRSPALQPPVPVKVGLVEALHLEILRFARWTRPSPEIQRHVEAAIDCVRRGVRDVWPNADVEVFGSFATGLCLQHSDVDLAVIDAPRIPSSENLSFAQVSAMLIRELAAGLRNHSWCESINPLETASMPVLKCFCRPFSPFSTSTPAIAVDITIGGTRNISASADRTPGPGKLITRHTGGTAREYVLQKINELPALAPLVLLLKSFLHHKGLSNVYSGGLGSFSLTLLVAFFLERVGIEGCVDPRAAESPTSPLSCSEFSDSDTLSSSSSSFGATSNDSGSSSIGEFYVKRAASTIDRVLRLWNPNGSLQLGRLLIGFLQTFGCVRDLSREKIVLRGLDGSPGGFFPRDNRHVALWIDDPLRPGVNVGAGSFGMIHVQNAFKQMCDVLLGCPSVLTPLQCEDKDCQDLVTMSELPYLGRLVLATRDFQ
ncbi:hypothetical protein KP509_11G073500 [Ceratopteris richardii]|nr:hypothetical protein KP509_11G073500 [Ceratopteris richardii]